MSRAGECPGERWQLVVLLCGGHDYPTRFPKYRLEDGMSASLCIVVCDQPNVCLVYYFCDPECQLRTYHLFLPG